MAPKEVAVRLPFKLGGLGLALLALAAVALAAYRSRAAEDFYSPGYGKLLDSAPRPLEPRLSGAPHAPFLASRPRDERWERALRAALLAAREKPGSDLSSAELGERAGLSLLLGCPRAAISRLRRAISLAPRDPRLWTDLSAAYLLAAEAAESGDSNRKEPDRRCGRSGMTSDEGLDALDALEAASTAIELAVSGQGSASAAAAARFDRALALEALHLDRKALIAWDEASAAEPDSDWAAEARGRRSALAARIDRPRSEPKVEERAREGDAQAAARLVRDDPQQAIQWAGRDLLWDWAAAFEAGRSDEAGRRLSAAAALAVPLAERGDRLAADSVAVLRGLDLSRRHLAVRGFRSYAEGWPLYRAFENEKAIAVFESARRDLETAGLPQALEVDLYQAVAEHNAGQPGAASRVAAVEARLGGRGYLDLSALAARIRALLASRGGLPHEAAEGYRQSRDLYDRLGEVDRRATVDSLLAQQLERLGRRRDAWQTNLGAASVAPRVRDPYLRRTIWGQLAFFAQAADRLRSALEFQDEMQRAASEQGDPNAVNESLLLRAAMRTTRGDALGADADVAAVRKRVPSIPDAGDRARTEADLARVEGVLRIDRAPAEAARQLDSAVEHYAATGQRVLEGTARAARARARTAIGDLAGAEADLSTLVAFADRGGEGWLDGAGDEDRYRFGRETRRAFAEMVRFQALEAHRPELAFAFAETSRELLAPRPPLRPGVTRDAASFHAPRLQTLRAALPAETVLLEYALFEDRLVSWLIAPEGAWSFTRRVSKAEIERLAQRLDPDKGGLNDEAWKETSARLFDLLLRPQYARLGRERTLVVVPDGPLGQVPWSGLWDRERGRFVIEDRAVLVNPSASFYLRALARSRELDSTGTGPSRILVVGDPAFDTHEWPRLSRLPAARKEAVEIGKLYGSNATVLTEERATWDAFRTAARDADVIHLGMHASLDPVDPFRSFLLFADPGARGARTLRDLAAVEMPRARLAILAACESAGENREGEGVVGLARPFLAAGVPTVVGSLWPVNDRLTAGTWTKLYQSSSMLSFAKVFQEASEGLNASGISSFQRFTFIALGS